MNWTSKKIKAAPPVRCVNELGVHFIFATIFFCSAAWWVIRQLQAAMLTPPAELHTPLAELAHALEETAHPLGENAHLYDLSLNCIN